MEEKGSWIAAVFSFRHSNDSSGQAIHCTGAAGDVAHTATALRPDPSNHQQFSTEGITPTYNPAGYPVGRWIPNKTTRPRGRPRWQWRHPPQKITTVAYFFWVSVMWIGSNFTGEGASLQHLLNKHACHHHHNSTDNQFTGINSNIQHHIQVWHLKKYTKK